MKITTEFIADGCVTAPAGFTAGAIHAGIKYSDPNHLDLAILYSQTPAGAAAVFTTNKVKAAPVLLDIQRLQKGKISAVVMNSGYANACTGQPGMADAIETTAIVAKKLGVKPESVLSASTGTIGVNLPMERIKAALPKIKLTADGGHDLERAIMTTDTVPKEAAVRGDGFTIGGCLKGAGMIHPNMATMLCFLTTDAPVEKTFLKKALLKAIAISFNLISVDVDDSTNDTVLLLANGAAGGPVIKAGSKKAGAFQQALNKICLYLAKEAVRDGEGATKLIEINVGGAASVKDARKIARTVIDSSLVKTAVYGSDPNWGRVLAAAGRSGAAVDPDKMDLYMGSMCMAKGGAPVPFDKQAAKKYMDNKEVVFRLEMNLGKGQATAWGCDLTEKYVKINAEYTT